jgi:hypothetical protein
VNTEVRHTTAADSSVGGHGTRRRRPSSQP